MANESVYVDFSRSFPKHPGCLGYIGDYTTHRDYNKPILGSLLTNQDFMERRGPRCFFRSSFELGKHDQKVPPKTKHVLHLQKWGGKEKKSPLKLADLERPFFSPMNFWGKNSSNQEQQPSFQYGNTAHDTGPS